MHAYLKKPLFNLCFLYIDDQDFVISTVYSSELPGVTLLTSGMRGDQYLVYVYVAILIIELNLPKPNFLGTSLYVRFIQVKSTKMFKIGISLTVGFIHVSCLVRVSLE